MRKLGIVSIGAAAALGLAVMAAPATAKDAKPKGKRLVGTWSLVSTDNTNPDGSKSDIYGPNPQGMLIFDKTGHYSLIIVRSDLPKFAASTSNKAMLAAKILRTHLSGASR